MQPGVIRAVDWRQNRLHIMDNAKIQKIFLNGRKAYQLYQRYMFPENPEFVGSTLDYGDNYQFADGERVYNELETEFYEYVGNFRATGDTFASLEWKPVDEML
jgi:hypothetical protein